MTSEVTADRFAQIARGLESARARVRDACLACGRDPGEVGLVVVTKHFPAADVRVLADLGVRAVGENRHQEARDKVAAVDDPRLSWHFVGQLQSNKAAAVAGYAAVVESVDRPKVLPGLDSGARERDAVLECLVQVDLDPPGAGGRRGGAAPDRVVALAEQVAGREHLRLGGVMAVAPLGQDPAPAFARLAEVAAEVRRVRPEAITVSAGMSADLEAAVAAGATHVRLGSAVLGPRPPIA